jgi:hypothetical protein
MVALNKVERQFLALGSKTIFRVECLRNTLNQVPDVPSVLYEWLCTDVGALIGLSQEALKSAAEREGYRFQPMITARMSETPP